MRCNRFGILLISVLVFACSSKGDKLFDLPSGNTTGVTFSNDLTETEDLNIIDYLYFYNGGGVAVGDINNDSLPDIYLSGNQVKNKLYLNKGGLKFEDITEQAGVAGNSDWNTGVTMGDINGDGWLDIYVCAVVGIKGLDGYNELFINNGDGTFTEKAADYGLDFDTYSSSAALLDFDKDGDLDIFLLNHAVHTQESFGKADLRYTRNSQTGDKLLRNDGDTFTEVSEEAGIYGGINGYGLGVAIADFNQDGWPDIYVGNDFHEDDYYYLNNGDGTFTESLKDYFGYSSRFSMGNDVADINHDGWPDIISLDMLPEDEVVLKSSEGDDNVQTQRLRTERFGYHYQFTRNMLHLNRQESGFAETALLSGIAATDWSWSALFEDFDSDGEQDLFVSNGIPKRPNDLDYIRFVSSEQIQNKISNTRMIDREALDLMPSGNTYNYVYKGKGELAFEDMSGRWIPKDTVISAATAFGDLDRDGDLDIITNNLNQEASIYVNQTAGNEGVNYLNLRFDYKEGNQEGIGTKVMLYQDGTLQYKELYTVRGFQATSEAMIHFGLGETTIDSLRIIWPDNSSEVLTQLAANQDVTLRPGNTKPFDFASLSAGSSPIFKAVDGALGIDFKHEEDRYIDFNRQKLIPYKISDRGPATAIGDLNGDGKDDIYFGGSKFKSSKVYIQQDSSYQLTRIPSLERDSVLEVVDARILQQDDQTLVFKATGGGDFFGLAPPLLDASYVRTDSLWVQNAVPVLYENAAVVIASDYNDNGKTDLFIGNHGVTGDYGKIPTSYLLEMDEQGWTLIENQELASIGMITDAVWDDYDGDGDTDLIVIGEWMSPQFFENTDGTLARADVLSGNLNGLWQAIEPFDMDGDGDTDYVLGNWGLNTKFKASQNEPVRMYYGDFDNNRATETVVAVAKNGAYYPIESLDGLASQLEFLRRSFTAYKDFAGKTVEEILPPETLKEATLFEVHEMRSGYLENENGRFRFVPFTTELQTAPIMAYEVFDFDGDGTEELLAGGNYFGVKPYHGRLGSFSGAMIKSKNDVLLGHTIGLDLARKSVRDLSVIRLNNQPYLLVTVNDAEAEVYAF